MIIPERFKNKIALVTGSADGIGKGVACRLAREGARVALLDINTELLKQTVQEFNSEGLPAKGYTVDISSEEQVQQAVAAVAKDFGRIDILVNAAGIVGPTNTKI